MLAKQGQGEKAFPLRILPKTEEYLIDTSNFVSPSHETFIKQTLISCSHSIASTIGNNHLFLPTCAAPLSGFLGFQVAWFGAVHLSYQYRNLTAIRAHHTKILDHHNHHLHGYGNKFSYHLVKSSRGYPLITFAVLFTPGRGFQLGLTVRQWPSSQRQPPSGSTP